MKKNFVFGLTVAVSVFLASNAWATPGLIFTNIRQMGMGGTGIAVANDAHALYQNPAALSNIHGFHLNLLDIRGDASSELISNVSKIRDVAKTGNGSSGQVDQLKSLTPLKFGLSGAMTPVALTWNRFGFGIFTQGQMNANLLRPSQPKIQLNGLADTAAIIGKSFDIHPFGRTMTVGITGKYINRYTTINDAKTSTTIEKDTASLINIINGTEDFPTSNFNGSGFGIDIGTLMPFSTKRGDGQWGLVVKNIGSNLNGDATTSTGKTGMSMQLPIIAGVGFGMDTKAPLVGKVLVAGDYYFASDQGSFWKNLHFGAEKKVLKRVALRGGLNQGYLTAGVGVNLWVARLDYAYFQQALGSDVGIDEQSYHIVQLGFGFGS